MSCRARRRPRPRRAPGLRPGGGDGGEGEEASADERGRCEDEVREGCEVDGRLARARAAGGDVKRGAGKRHGNRQRWKKVPLERCRLDDAEIASGKERE